MALSRLVGAYVGLAIASLLCGILWTGILPSRSATPSVYPLLFYQNVIGQLDGRSCPSYPVCSAYAREALATHGWLLGSWLAMDRLIHEAGDLHSKRWILVDGQIRMYDPLSRNDRWISQRSVK